MDNSNSESNNFVEPSDASAIRSSESPDQSDGPSQTEPKKRSTWKIVVLLTILAGSFCTWNFLTTPYDHAPIEPVRKAQVQQAVTKPKSIESQLVGTWRDHYHGQRTLTLRADGTGTMICELAGLEAALFAKKLTFEEAWHVEDGQLVMRVTGGEPKSKIDFVLNMKGDTTTQKILELTKDRLLVHDKGEEQDFDWKRLDDDSPAEDSSRPMEN